ncbi:MAG TPA: Hachiman antiphage defense system protein HamA, partial [Puia sp.]|nr:Hachiman antiphage defense system protein HamA [Puia sp.]
MKSSDGKPIEIWEFKHQADTKILTSWAKHFRNHYCLDDHIDILRKGTGMSRSEFLNNIKFPDGPGGNKIGPGIRSGDFGEILISDYLQYILSFWVPRTTRYSDKNIRNESEKGCDIIGFKMLKSKESPSDALAVFEAKAQFSGRKANPRLQDAVDGSAKDWIRLAESLSAIKQRLLEQQKLQEADTVERFQNFNDRPYKPMWGAAALFDTSVYDP